MQLKLLSTGFRAEGLRAIDIAILLNLWVDEVLINRL